MRQSSNRSLLTLAAIFTALIVFDAPVRSQPTTHQKTSLLQFVNLNITPIPNPVEVKISRTPSNE
ncbi:MAG: hypothetical protein ACK45W_21065, partial [Pseudanabaena sp.]